MDESLGAALQAAVERQRRSVLNRREGLPTALLEGVGRIPMNIVGAGAGLVDAAREIAAEQTGTAPEISTDYDPRRIGGILAAENAMNVVGVPALTGGVPAAALGSGMRNNWFIENAEQLKQLALNKRNEGRGSTATVYPTAKALEASRGGPGPFDDITANWRAQKGDVIEDYRRAAFPERYGDAPTLQQAGEEIMQRDLDVIPFSNFTDKPTAGALLAANNADLQTLAQRKVNAKLKPTVAQKPMDEGLFGDTDKQLDLVDILRKFGAR